LAAVLASAVDKGRHVRIVHACSLIRQMLQVTHLERFLDQHGPKTQPQLVRKIQESVA